MERKNHKQAEAMVEVKNLSFSYEHEVSPNLALDNITLNIDRGDFVAILGANGSGKSTLARHINALLPVQKGKLQVAGFDAKLEANKWIIRQHCGMVFQNLENQFVSSLIEEDIAFGLENYQYPQSEIPQRVARALETVGLLGFEKRNPAMLSGGQKQRVAIAGVLAVDPEILILDEATSMLDAEGRQDVLEIVQRLHQQQHKTIIMITHFVDEAVLADRVCLMYKGKIVRVGSPREIFSQVDLLSQVQLSPPFSTELYFKLAAGGMTLPEIPLNHAELVRQLCQLK